MPPTPPTTTPPAGGPPAKKSMFGGLSKEQKIAIGVAGGGGALGLLVLARRGAKATPDPSADTSLAGVGQMPTYSDAGIGAYNNLQNEIDRLNEGLRDVRDQLGPGAPVKQIPPVPLPHPIPKPPIKKIVPPRPPPKKPPVSPPHFYVVKAGDTLSKIAGRLGIKGGWQALYNRNKGVVGPNPNLIHPGQRLAY
jgi:LysM repeat protein